MKKLDKQKRMIQLVSREGVLTQILEEYEWPTEGHKKVIELLYEETLEEMAGLGLKPVDDPTFGMDKKDDPNAIPIEELIPQDELKEWEQRLKDLGKY